MSVENTFNTEENTFNTEEDKKVGEILRKASNIKDKEERALFIEEGCNGNLAMYEYVLECLEEMEDGEKGFEDLSLKSGTEVGNYVIVEKINQGGIASVYSAAHKDLKTLAAIKVFDKLDGETVENDLFWKTDYESLSRFNHDNIVKLYDVGSHEKNGKKLRYITVEFVKGYHFDEYSKLKVLSIHEVLRLFQDLCEVIEFIHNEEKILHLDLKPSNILVTADRPHRIKLIDFGSSKPFLTESKQFTRLDLLNPLTLKYAPPEQYSRNEVLTGESDIYSLGVILYLLITEKLPFGEGEKDKEKIKQEVADRSLLPILPSERVLELEDETKFGVSIKTLSEILSGDLDSIIMKTLKKRRRDRYQSVSELRRDIDNFLKGKPVKARKKTTGYKTIKSISQVLGFKGGLIGWDKWKTPIKRLSFVALLLTVLSVAGISYSIYKASLYTVGRRMENPKNQVTLRTFNQFHGYWSISENTLIPDKNIINIYCGTKAQEDICFTFMLIPRGEFTMGLRDNEKFTDVSENSKKIFFTKQPGENTLKKDDAITIAPGKENPEEITISAEEKSALPKHDVKINKDFYMAKFEITNKQWNIIAKISDSDLEVTDEESSLPKTSVSYANAVEFCKRLTKALKDNGHKNIEIRLPSEAEWEYACRAENRKESEKDNTRSETYNPKVVNAISLPEDNPFRFGFEPILRNINKPKPESSLIPNSYGLVGMNGNVWEIVADAWHDAYNDGKDKNGQTVNMPMDENPWGNPVSDENKSYVVRGGAYNEHAYMTQCSYRKAENNNLDGNGQTGFRVVMIIND